MNPVAAFLAAEGIALDVEAASRKRAFEELAVLFEKTAGISRRVAFDALNARERLGCTALGGGVAIPHGRIEGLEKIAVVLLRTKNSVAFDTPDNRRARLFVGILIPSDDEEHYLPVLAAVAALFKDRSAKEALLSAEHAQEICRIISEFALTEENPESEA